MERPNNMNRTFRPRTEKEILRDLEEFSPKELRKIEKIYALVRNDPNFKVIKDLRIYPRYSHNTRLILHYGFVFTKTGNDEKYLVAYFPDGFGNVCVYYLVSDNPYFVELINNDTNIKKFTKRFVEPINEGEVFRPKTKEEILELFQEEKVEQLKKMFKLVKSLPKRFKVLEGLRFYPPRNLIGHYGFTFELKGERTYTVAIFPRSRVFSALRPNFFEDTIILSYADKCKDLDTVEDFKRYFGLSLNENKMFMPKTREEIMKELPSNKINEINEIYELVKSKPNRFNVIKEPQILPTSYGYISHYGFVFTNEEYKRKYRIGYWPNWGGFALYSELSHICIHANEVSIEDFFKHFFVKALNESGTFVPKSSEEVKGQFEEENPRFTKIFNDVRGENVGQTYHLDVNKEGGYTAYFSFEVSNEEKPNEPHVFMVTQHSYPHYVNRPQVGYLDRSRSGHGIGGIIANQKTIFDTSDLEEYVEKTLKERGHGNIRI